MAQAVMDFPRQPITLSALPPALDLHRIFAQLAVGRAQFCGEVLDVIKAFGADGQRGEYEGKE